MNVGELRNLLSELPEDAPIFVDGYEGGVKDLAGIDPVHVKLNQHNEWYYGPHEIMDLSDSYDVSEYGEPDCAGFRLR